MEPTKVSAPAPGNTPRQWAVLGILVAVFGYFLIRNGSLQRYQLIYFAVLVPSIILHEVSHGAVALIFGDTTAKRAGRLTLNPLKHIDPFWTILVPAMMVITTGQAFGMAKPVPVNPNAMRDPRNHSLLTSLAGPATNLVLAAVALVVFKVTQPQGTVADVLALFGAANVVLAVFNMLPIPPLDGSALVERLLPRRLLVPYLRLRQYSFFLFIGLFFLARDLLGNILGPAVELWFRLLRT